MSNLVLKADDISIKNDEKYDSITITGADSLISYETVSEVIESLNVHGQFIIKYTGKVADSENELKLSGLLSVSTSESDTDGTFVVSGVKPDLSAGGQRRIKRKIPDFKSILAETDNVELLDDDALLKEEDLIKPSMNEAEECGPKAQKKACKNCSCGLKEVEEADAISNSKDVTPAVIDTTTAKSSCGSVSYFIV